MDNKINSEKVVDEIIKNLEEKSNDMIYSFVGPNGSGKTTLLNKLKNKIIDNNKYNVFYLNNEILISDELKENKQQKEFKAQLRKFLNEYLSEKADINDSDDFSKKIKKIKDKLSDIQKAKYEFKHFKKEFLELFILDKDISEGHLKIEIMNDSKWNFKSFSSGEGLFSLMCLMKNILEKVKIKNENKIILIVDEPEKFLHDSLIKKIAKFFYELWELNVFIFFSTHSSYLINELVINFRINNKKFNVIKMISQEECLKVKDSLFDNGLNYRELNIITKSLFDDYIILVEGINDYEFANLLCITNFNDYFFNVYDCNGKNGILKLCLKIHNFNQNVFSFFDKDYNKKNSNSKSESDSFRKKYDENKWKYYEFDDNIEDFFANELKKDEFHKKITKSHIENNPKVEEVKKLLKKFFSDNIKENSND